MSWIERLYQTYESCQAEVGKVIVSEDPKKSDPIPLLPICHTTQNAQIEIHIDKDGNWKPMTARALEKAEGITVIPCTEKSANRAGSMPYPHPLFDKIQYLTPEYSEFGGEKYCGYDLYMENLKDWCLSEYNHPSVCAIYSYLQKNTLIKDLIADHVLYQDENGKILEKWEGEEKPLIFRQVSPPSASFVRFVVDDCILYEDIEVRNAYIQYQTSLGGKTDLCYVQGKKMIRSDASPSKIRNTGDKAKLISANDGSGFTFRGRFETSNQALSIGFETTNKAHNALKWLVSKQGWRNGDQVILAWGLKKPEVIDFMSELVGFEDEKQELPATTELNYAKKINHLLSGYGNSVEENEKIAIIALDSATTGRLSIPYYRELGGGEFMERLQNWYSTCVWQMRKKITGEDGKEKWVSFVGTPTPLDIIKAAYGKNMDDKFKKAAIERILPCIIDGARLPKDLVKMVARRAAMPQAMEEWEWNQTLQIACALLRKQKIDKQRFSNQKYKEEYVMALNPTNYERSYLFGRLLAYANHAESLALFLNGEKRETNAKRLMHQFSISPVKTFGYLRAQLTHYYQKLVDNGNWIENEIAKIMSEFAEGDYNNQRLNDDFLLGYYCQTAELRRKKEKQETNENE